MSCPLLQSLTILSDPCNILFQIRQPNGSDFRAWKYMLFFTKRVSTASCWSREQMPRVVLDRWVRQRPHWHCQVQKVLKLQILIRRLGDKKPPAFLVLWELSSKKNSQNFDISGMWLPKGLFKM